MGGNPGMGQGVPPGGAPKTGNLFGDGGNNPLGRQ